MLEEGYGLGVGIPVDAYLEVSGRARIGSYEECLDQDVIVVLRCPEQRIFAGCAGEPSCCRCCITRRGRIAPRSSLT